MINVSSRFKELILGPSSFASLFDGGRIVLYDGVQPASADYAATTPLAEVTDQGMGWAPDGGAGGLNFVQSGVWATNDPAQVWTLTGTAAGTATWFRLYARSLDDGGLSFSAVRLDGSVGTGGSVDMKLVTAAMTVGYTVPVQQFLFSLPPILGA